MEANSKDIQINNNKPKTLNSQSGCLHWYVVCHCLGLQVVEYMLPPLPVPAQLNWGSLILWSCTAYHFYLGGRRLFWSF